MEQQRVLVTGAAGFIGSHLVDVLLDAGHRVVGLDLLTYAASMGNLANAQRNPSFIFVQGDICDTQLVRSLLREHSIQWIAHLAAETHVDNSIDAPAEFIRTNVFGTFSLLQSALAHWKEGARDLRFLHVSTDEVFGQLGRSDAPFTELSPYRPNSPYSASKAGADHLARAWFHTYGLPIVITNCSNNFGPRQHREKLIPHMIAAAMRNAQLPVYGDGSNIRDWLFVRDHCRGLLLALTRGKVGETYCFGGDCERANIDLVGTLCRHLDEMKPRGMGRSYAELITFVKDRPGHDWRYAIDSAKAKRDLGFKACGDFEAALRDTIRWYLDEARTFER